MTNSNPIEERAHVQKMVDLLHRKSQIRSNFLFLVAYDCNFRCPYCFENATSSNGKGWSKKTFTKDSVDRAYDAMLEIEPNRDLHSKGITLYGGEPLLKKNKKIVEYIVEKGTLLGYQFSAITNGYELDDFKHLLNPSQIGSLQITIDGDREKHDSRRTHYEDGGSFDKIIQNIEMCLDLGVSISVRVNIGDDDFSDIKKLNTSFKEKGFFKRKGKFSFYSALIHSAEDLKCNVVMDGTSDISTNSNAVIEESFIANDYGHYNPDSQYINFEAEEKRLSSKDIVFHDDKFEVSETETIRTINRAKYIDIYHEQKKEDNNLSGCQDFGIRSKIMNAVNGKGLMSFKSTFCGVQNGMIIFDPCGDLYTCWELVGIEKYKVGTYKEKVEYDEEELDRWYGKNIGKTNACSHCKYAFFCGGGCMAHALQEGRGYDSPYCDGLPKVFHSIVKDVYQTKLKNN